MAALQAYAGGERHSGLMQPIASGLHPEEISGLALYYSTLPLPSLPPYSQQPSSAVIERGKKIATQGIPSQLCHRYVCGNIPVGGLAVVAANCCVHVFMA